MAETSKKAKRSSKRRTPMFEVVVRHGAHGRVVARAKKIALARSKGQVAKRSSKRKPVEIWRAKRLVETITSSSSPRTTRRRASRRATSNRSRARRVSRRRSSRRS